MYERDSPVYDGGQLMAFRRPRLIRKTVLIAGCVLGLAAPAAHAQSDVRLRMDSHFYIGAGVGRSEARDFCGALGGACDAKDMSWNIFAGYQFTPNFAVEVGYNDFGKATSSGFIGGVPGAISSESTALEIVGLAAAPLTDAFSVYIKGGFFRFDTDAVGTGGAAGLALSDKGSGATFGVGAEYSFTRNFAARLEWQRYLSVTETLIGGSDGDIGVLRFTTRYKF